MANEVSRALVRLTAEAAMVGADGLEPPTLSV